MKYKIVIPLPEDADDTVIQLPNPTDKDKKTPALLSFGIDVNKNPNILMLTVAYRELGSFLMDRESKQLLILPTWNGRNHIVVINPQKSQRVDTFVANATGLSWVDDLLPDNVTREGMKKYLSSRDKAKPIVQMDTFKMEVLASILNLTGRKLNDMHFHCKGLTQTN
jgi:hypothetical protein